MTTQYRADLNRRPPVRPARGHRRHRPRRALAVAIALALAGAGYWALVAQQLATSFVLLVGAVVCARWIPRLPQRREPMGDLLTFGWHLAGSQFIGYLGNNVDSLTIGYRFGATLARSLQPRLPAADDARSANSAQPTTTWPCRCCPGSSDDRAVRPLRARGQLALGFTLVAGLGLVVGAAGPDHRDLSRRAVVERRTDPAAARRRRHLPDARVRRLLGLPLPWADQAAAAVHRDRHRSRSICILIGSHWGVLGVAGGYAVAPALAWPLSFWWLSKKSTISVRGLFKGAGKILVLSAAIGGAAYGACVLLAAGGPWLQLGSAVLAAAMVYGAALLVPSYRRDFRGVLEIARQGLARRR